MYCNLNKSFIRKGLTKDIELFKIQEIEEKPKTSEGELIRKEKRLETKLFFSFLAFIALSFLLPVLYQLF